MKHSLPLLVMAAVILSACPKKEEPAAASALPAAAIPAKTAEPQQEQPSKQEPQQEEPKKEEPATAAAAAAAAAAPEDDCGALHDFIKEMKEALTAKLGQGKATKPLPPREKFVAACKTLPAEVRRCMNPKTQMAEPEECRATMEKFQKENAAAMAKFQAMMK